MRSASCAPTGRPVRIRSIADQPRQADGAEVDQRHTEAAAEDAEGRVLGDHAHVRPQCELHAAGHRKALDRGDHRFRQPKPARPHRRDGVEAAELALLLGVTRRDLLQIRAGAEIAVDTGEDSDGSVLVRIEGEEGVIQFSRSGAVHGIAAMRPVDRNDGYRALAIDENGIFFGHARLPVVPAEPSV
jgi:hypothetical protein